MKVLVIGCGGTGTNWTKSLVPTLSGANVESVNPDVEMLIIDGSKSNVRDAVEFKDVPMWLCPNTDGAGKDRAKCVREYKEFLASKMHEMPEADLYIVAYSTSGGSGSVFGPEVTLALLAQGKSVIGVSTLTASSKSDARNSYNVIRGLASYARKSGKPVVSFMQNGDKLSTTDVDAAAKAAIEALTYAASDNLGALDTADVGAFLDYTRHGVEPTLTEMTVTPKVEVIREDHGKYLTTLSVIPDRSAELPNVDELTDLTAIGGECTLYFGTRIDRMTELLAYVTKQHEHFEKLAKSHAAVSVFDTEDDMEY